MRAPLGRAGDGKQKRVEVGNVSAAAGLSCEACTNLSSHMGDFTVLMPMDMDVRSNWEVMTRLVPKTAGATSAHQSKPEAGWWSQTSEYFWCAALRLLPTDSTHRPARCRRRLEENLRVFTCGGSGA